MNCCRIRRVAVVILGGVALSVAGCASSGALAKQKTITIRWQRLVNDAGDTCGRCGDTERSLAEAQRRLAASLKPLGMRVQVVKTELTSAEFQRDPNESNRIWIGDRTLESILGAQTGTSACAGACGGTPCRTMMVDGQSYESIPPELIVRAGMRVAADLIKPAPATNCCPAGAPCPTPASPDLQPMPWLSN